MSFVNAYFGLAYGVWTLFNILRYFWAAESCFIAENMNINMYNYQLIILIGVFPLTATILVLVFALVLVAMVLRNFLDGQR